MGQDGSSKKVSYRGLVSGRFAAYVESEVPPESIDCFRYPSFPFSEPGWESSKVEVPSIGESIP